MVWSKFKPKIAKQFDEIKDESPQIIIAGFGRFGQIFGRILRAQEIPFVAIEHDSNQVELLRKFGSRVYFGDATRVDLLEAAGAHKTKYFILAIDDVELSLQAAKIVREHFPQIKVFARARNRGHAFDLLDLGITNIKREILDSSVFFTYDLFVDMGIQPKKLTESCKNSKSMTKSSLKNNTRLERTTNHSLLYFDKVPFSWRRCLMTTANNHISRFHKVRKTVKDGKFVETRIRNLNKNVSKKATLKRKTIN